MGKRSAYGATSIGRSVNDTYVWKLKAEREETRNPAQLISLSWP